jgi:hypothetical protein
MTAGPRSAWAAELRPDNDGPPFVDILLPFRNVTDAPKRLVLMAASCHYAIKTKLDESIYDPAIFKKLRWLAIYWNGIAMSEGSMGHLKVVDFP